MMGGWCMGMNVMHGAACTLQWPSGCLVHRQWLKWPPTALVGVHVHAWHVCAGSGRHGNPWHDTDAWRHWAHSLPQQPRMVSPSPLFEC